MVDEGSRQMGFRQHSAGVMLDSPSSGTNTRSMPMRLVYGSDWESMNSIRPTGDFGASIISQRELTTSSSFPLLLETQGISSSPDLAIYPTNTNLVQMLPKLQMYGSGNYHEMVNPFGLPGSSQNPHAIFPQNYVSSRTQIDDKRPVDAAQAERSCQMSEGRTVGVSPNSKRKRDSEPNSPANKNSEGEPLKDHSSETSCRKEPDDKRQNTAGNLSDKQAGKQVKDNIEGEEASKQNYIHVRARRGQATNSHSLAERVRREKISERMRLLQELVPGCNKITGKAVMLDEIINYVQSLQQQVEFLSMKLATVNPELNFDIERLLSKDINNSRGSGPPILGFDQGMSSSNAFTQGIHQAINTKPNAASLYHHMCQVVWDGDLQSLLQMGFDSNSALGGLGPNGNSKSEL